MLEDNLQKARSRGYDPIRFGDPVALKTEWVPTEVGGANFCTHRLVRSGQWKMKFRVTFGTVFMFLLIFLAGIGILILTGFSPSDVLPFVIGLVFTLSGGFLLVLKTKPITIDMVSGYFYTGRKGPGEYFGSDNPKIAKLLNVHALQLIAWYVRGKRSYYTYEINLVLNNGNRIPVVSHGNKRKIREDADALSAFLNKPVWDVIE